MTEHITASPLCWPKGWRREGCNEDSRFGKWQKPVTIAKATSFVLAELKRMGVPDIAVIISTDLKLRLDGLPYSNQKEPKDQGAAVWWTDGDDEQKVIAIDKYNRMADNIYAIGKTIEALRGIERWGSGEILERTFDGFTALPNPDGEPLWWEVLGFGPGQMLTRDDVIRRHRELSLSNHPDRGGDVEKMAAINQARDTALKEMAA